MDLGTSVELLTSLASRLRADTALAGRRSTNRLASLMGDEVRLRAARMRLAVLLVCPLPPVPRGVLAVGTTRRLLGRLEMFDTSSCDVLRERFLV